MRGALWVYCLILIATGLLVLAVSCTEASHDPAPTPTPPQTDEQVLQGAPDEQVVSGAPIDRYRGETLLEERIANSEVIVRATLKGVVAEAGFMPTTFNPILGTWNAPDHVATLKLTFTVHEYIKGTVTGDEIVGVLLDIEDTGTEAEAVARGTAMLSERDQRWDDREAIVFLSEDSRFDDYLLGSVDWYSITSPHTKRWLPSATTSSTGARADSSEGTNPKTPADPLFLLGEPQGGGASGQSQARSASSSSDSAPTIALSAFKTRVAGIQTELAAGDGTDAYQTCIEQKYFWQRYVTWRAAKQADGVYPQEVQRETIDSGLASGSRVYPKDYVIPDDLPVWPDYPWNDLRILHNDADLFTVQLPEVVDTVRPLPAGEYRFYVVWRDRDLVPCDGQPEVVEKEKEVVVVVTAPPHAILEAFFDPQTIGSGDGYVSSGDVSTGDLSNTSFNLVVGNVSTSITALTGDASNVVLSLDPYNAMAGHTLDFITGDGTTSLTLTGDAVTGDSTAKTLTWAVGSKPWSSGDELMLRISASPPDHATRTRSDNAFTESTCDGAVTVPLWDDPVDDELLIDCEAIFDGIVTLQGGHLTRWNPQSNLDDWRGVSVGVVDGVVRVTGLDLTDMGMSGTFPASFAKVNSLETLKLTGNTFTGCIPRYLYYVDDHDLNTLGLAPCP